MVEGPTEPSRIAMRQVSQDLVTKPALPAYPEGGIGYDD